MGHGEDSTEVDLDGQIYEIKLLCSVRRVKWQRLAVLALGRGRKCICTSRGCTSFQQHISGLSSQKIIDYFSFHP